jgi:hypothetical protein
MEPISYKKEIETVPFQGKEIILENLTPILTPKQEAAKRRELEQQFYLDTLEPVNFDDKVRYWICWLLLWKPPATG